MHFFGRLHPLLVHLPIGILLLAFGMECLARWRRRTDLRPAIRLALATGAATALGTAATGWLLAQNGGYDDALLLRHQWLGFGAAALALAVWRTQDFRWNFPLFALAVAVLTAAGHYGGSLTHGEQFLFETKPEEAATSQAVPAGLSPDSAVFAGLIQPILKKRCVSCHNSAKRKGGLRLDSPEFIRRGGKNGPVIVPGRPQESPLLRRIHLPIPDDDHMPPAGKTQLSALETQLLEWWVEQGADFQKTLRHLPLPAALEAAMKDAPGANRNPVFARNEPAAPAADLERLRALFVSVRTLGTSEPWLAVSFAGQPNPGKPHWEALHKIKRQTVDLDLSNARIGDGDLPQLADFPNLVRLNLAHTSARNGLAAVLLKLSYLETLNLTGAAVTDTILVALGQLPYLKRLYAWQSSLTPAGIERLKRQRPALQVETGAADADTARMALRAPKILYGRSFFDDTVHVLLDYPSFRGVTLYYTLDEAASPTTQSAQYRAPIVLNRTAHVRSFAAKDGWLPSPLADAVFVKKQYSPVQATLARPPSPKYPAKGAASLIDGEIADLQGSGTWLGYEGEHMTAILDLGKPQPVSRVFVHSLENNASWVFLPAGIRVETSADGKTYRPAGSRRFPVNTSMQEQKTHLLSCELEHAATARFVRVRVNSALKNPAWHPGKGQKCWIFTDEILVE